MIITVVGFLMLILTYCSIPFISNHLNLPQVNHKDENKANNDVNNLEWCTAQYNNTYRDRVERAMKNRKFPVRQYDLNGNYIATWDSVTDASKNNDVNAGSISLCCRKLQGKTRNGYRWEFVNGQYKDIPLHTNVS